MKKLSFTQRHVIMCVMTYSQQTANN